MMTFIAFVFLNLTSRISIKSICRSLHVLLCSYLATLVISCVLTAFSSPTHAQPCDHSWIETHARRQPRKRHDRWTFGPINTAACLAGRKLRHWSQKERRARWSWRGSEWMWRGSSRQPDEEDVDDARRPARLWPIVGKCTGENSLGGTRRDTFVHLDSRR